MRHSGRFVVIGIALALVVSCVPCIESVKLLPTAEAVSFTERKLGKLSVAAEVNMKPCCPMSKQHAKTLNEIDAMIARITGEAARGELPIEEFDRRLKATEAGLLTARKFCEHSVPTAAVVGKPSADWIVLSDITGNAEDSSVTFRDRDSAIAFYLATALSAAKAGR